MAGRIYVGILVLGLSLGALVSLFVYENSTTSSTPDPLVDEYVRLVSVLYAKGESLDVVEARLDRLGLPNTTATVRGVVSRSLASTDQSTRATAGDLASLLETLAPSADAIALAPQRLIASGRGSEPTVSPNSTPQVLGVESAPTPTSEPTPSPSPTRQPTATQVAGQQLVAVYSAFLRAEPEADAPILGVIAKDTEVEVLAVVRGQAVEGMEERWYKVEHNGTTGYVYFTMLGDAS